MELAQLFIISMFCLLNYTSGGALNPMKCARELPSIGNPSSTAYVSSVIQCATYCEQYTTDKVFTYEGNVCKTYPRPFIYAYGKDRLGRYCVVSYTLNRRYCIVKKEMSFSDSVMACKQLSWSLLSIESEAEAKFIYKFIVDNKENATLVWTSGHMGLFEGTQQYYWLGSNSSMTYNGWIQGSPYSFSTSNGVVLNVTSPMWGHIEDTTILRSICEGTA